MLIGCMALQSMVAYCMLGWDWGTEGGVTNRPYYYLVDQNGGLASAFERPPPRLHHHSSSLVDLDVAGGRSSPHPYKFGKAEGSALGLHGNGSLVVARSGGSLDLNAFGWERNN